VIQLD